jgi:RHS repeat-associated protein
VIYDALGRVVEQNKSGVYSEIGYAPTGDKIEIMNGQSFTKAFVPLPGGAVAVYTPSLEYYRHPDHLGSSRFASTTSRTMYSDVAYAPFGEPYAQTGSTDVSFTGMNQDTVSNLYDFPAREYGIQGRWPSPDPAGLAAVNPTKPQSWNRYAYLLNNPLSAVDPLGLCGEEENPGFDDYVTCEDEGGSNNGGGVSPSTACTDVFDPCTPGNLNANSQPNLAGMFNEGPGGYSYGGVDALFALDCAAANKPADMGCWGVKLSLNGGLLQGSFSLDGFASSLKDASKDQITGIAFSITTGIPGVDPLNFTISLSPTARPDPLDPQQLVSSPKQGPPPSPTTYVCPALATQIRLLQLQSVGNPSIAKQLAALEAMYQKSCP